MKPEVYSSGKTFLLIMVGMAYFRFLSSLPISVLRNLE